MGGSRRHVAMQAQAQAHQEVMTCRSCGRQSGAIVLDLGRQPAADHFPASSCSGPDPRHPLRLWLCATCGLAQLREDPTVPEEPRGTEPAALVAQAADAVGRVHGAGFLAPGGRVAEFGSPHGGSWIGHLIDHGLRPAVAGEQADVVLDCFGLMHEADQAAGLEQRVERLAPGGTLLLQYHSLEAILRQGQWTALRHGHFAYYSTTALTTMLAGAGWRPQRAWTFPLYGGTVLLSARRAADPPELPDPSVDALLDADRRARVTDPDALSVLQGRAEAATERLRRWLGTERDAGRSVVGYGAASRAVAVLARAAVDRSLLTAVVDASPAKHGRRMPGTDVPIVPPAVLAASPPGSVLLFVPDLLDEVRLAFPVVEAAGGRWVDAQALLG